MEISRARHRAELVTDDRKALGEHLESATGERVAALESLEPASEAAQQQEPGTVLEALDGVDKGVERVPDPVPDMEMEWSGPDLEL